MVPAIAVSQLHAIIQSQWPAPGRLYASGLTTLSTYQRTKLTTLLIEYGVPESKATQRTDLVIQNLGVPAILAASVAKNNRAALKQQANKPGLTLRLVQPDELARHAEKAAALKYGAGISNHKSKKSRQHSFFSLATSKTVTVTRPEGKEVLITETTKAPAVPRPVNFLASSRTQQHMRNEAASTSSHSATSDPWLEPAADPWKTWQPSSEAAPAHKAATGKTHLATVTEQSRDELRATMQKDLADYKQQTDATMTSAADSANEGRFRKIDASWEIQAQQGQFSQWFTQVGQASAATESAIQTIQKTLSTHQQELHGLHEIQTVNDNVGTTLQKTLASHQSEMSEANDYMGPSLLVGNAGLHAQHSWSPCCVFVFCFGALRLGQPFICPLPSRTFSAQHLRMPAKCGRGL
eukprot:s87_g27.t1